MMYEEPSVVSREALCATLKKNISKEVSRDAIDCSGGKLGEGQFGEVFKGSFSRGGMSSTAAAIKMCKPDAGNKELVEFLREAAIMGQFDHPHIIQVYGYVTLTNPPMIAIELADCALGDRLEKKLCPTASLVGWAHELSMAMVELYPASSVVKLRCYLSKRGFIHRDLAVRNVLLVGDVAKLSDFGRSRRLASVDDIYAAGNSLVPIRWTAPEALAKGMYSSASDVWSFGIMLYEMWTRGALPYDASWSNVEVYEKLETGWRLGPPKQCPRGVYKLMLSCWHPQPSSRPTFVVIDGEIRTIRHSKALLADRYKGEPEPMQFQYELEEPPTIVPRVSPTQRPPPDKRQEICYTPDDDLRDPAGDDPSVVYSVPDKERSKTASPSPNSTLSAQNVHALEANLLTDTGALADEYDEDDYVILKDSSRKTSQGSIVSGGDPGADPGAESDLDAVTEAHRLEKVHPKIMGLQQTPMQGSAKLAKRTSKWVSEWNDRKDSVSAKPPSASARVKTSHMPRSFFRPKASKLKPSKLGGAQ